MKITRHYTQKRKAWLVSFITAVICLLLSINTLHAKAKTGGVFSCELTVPLGAGASATIGGGVYTIPAGTHTIRANIDDINRFAESEERGIILSLPPASLALNSLMLL
ncbi:MAG: hypothetical protein M0R21_12225 [Lentimicrobiaceae bacterium]|nr:hypothetical protein [Lentimicrobiaceae bacterium]